jgi:hypothetical protein
MKRIMTKIHLRPVHWIAVALFFVVALTSYRAYAAGACASCFITNLYMRATDTWVQIGTGLPMSGPTCGSSNNTFMAVDIATPRGRSTLAMAQAAMLAGRQIDMTGTGNCTGPGNVEVMSTLWVKP